MKKIKDIFKLQKFARIAFCVAILAVGCDNRLLQSIKLKKEAEDAAKEAEMLKNEMEIEKIDAEEKMKRLDRKIEILDEKNKKLKKEEEEIKNEMKNIIRKNKVLDEELTMAKEREKVLEKKAENNPLVRGQLNDKKEVDEGTYRKLLMTYPVPGTRGMELGKLLIDTKLDIEKGITNLDHIESQFKIMLMQFENFNSYMPVFYTFESLMQRRYDLGLQSMAIQNGSLQVEKAKDLVIQIKKRYELLKNEEELLQADPEVRAKKAMSELNDKIKEIKNANINPLVNGTCIKDGKLTFQNGNSKIAAEKVVNKDKELIDAYIKRMANITIKK